MNPDKGVVNLVAPNGEVTTYPHCTDIIQTEHFLQFNNEYGMLIRSTLPFVVIYEM